MEPVQILIRQETSVKRLFAPVSWMSSWVDLDSSIQVGDELDISLSWRLLIPGSELLDALGRKYAGVDVVVLPLHERTVSADCGAGALVDEAITIVLDTGSNQRELSPLDPDRLGQFPESADLIQHLCVEISIHELAANPIVEVRRTRRALFSPSTTNSSVDFYPVAGYYFPLTAEAGESLGDVAEHMSIKVPYHLVCTEVVFHAMPCAGPISEAPEVFERCRSENRDAAAAVTGLKALRRDLTVALYDLSNAGGLASELKEESIKPLLVQLDEWDKLRRSVAPTVNEDRARYRPQPDAESLGELVDALELITKRVEATQVAITVGRHSDGSLDENAGDVEGLALSGISLAVNDRYVHVHRRPAKALALLAAVQVLLAFQLHFDIFDWGSAVSVNFWILPDLPWPAHVDSAAILAASRESAVALLLFFPALLFADLVRSRPVEPTLRQARYRYTTFLSLGYFAPLLPVVAYLGLDRPLSVAVSLLASASVAACVASLSLSWTRIGSLESARSELALALKDAL